MDLLDEEVFAVILAITIIGSVIGIAQVLRPEVAVEPFTALGLLNSECRIGDYPDRVFPNQNLTLCIFVFNHMGYPILAQVRYKIGDRESLPTNTTPSPRDVIKIFEFLIDSGENVTRRIEVPIAIMEADEATLIFELWLYDIDRMEWVYSGRWNHLHVKVVRVPLP